MSRWLVTFLFAATLSAQHTTPPATQPPNDVATQPDNDLPPEEDAAAKPETFAFNPVKSKQDVTVGLFYMKKGDFKAAIGRFREATKWNDGNPDAWFNLGEAGEKSHDTKTAKDAYTKFLQLAPDAKNAAEVKKRLARLL